MCAPIYLHLYASYVPSVSGCLGLFRIYVSCVSVSLCLSVCLFVSLFVPLCLPLCLPFCTRLSVSLYVSCLSLCLTACLRFYVSLSVFVYVGFVTNGTTSYDVFWVFVENNGVRVP